MNQAELDSPPTYRPATEPVARLRVGDRLVGVSIVAVEGPRMRVLCGEHPGVYPGERIWIEGPPGVLSVTVVAVSQAPAGTLIDLQKNEIVTSPKIDVTEYRDELHSLQNERRASTLYVLLTLMLATFGGLLFAERLGFIRIPNRQPTWAEAVRLVNPPATPARLP